MKRGLVMEGGDMRGLFTTGVTDVLLENKIVFEGVIDTSTGAVFGHNYKSNQPGHVLHYNLKYGADPRYGSLQSLLLTGGFYNEDFAYREVPFEKSPSDTKTFQRNPTEFYVVCTDMETGRPFYYRCEKGDAHDVEYMCASASMPLVAWIVEVDGHKLLDDGIIDSIPLKKTLSLGYEKNVVILTRPKGYRKERGASGTIVGVALKDYPRAFLAMKVCHLTYNQDICFVEEGVGRGRALLIYPREEPGMSRIASDPGKLMRVYELGRDAGLRALKRVRTYLGEREEHHIRSRIASNPGERMRICKLERSTGLRVRERYRHLMGASARRESLLHPQRICNRRTEEDLGNMIFRRVMLYFSL